MLNLIVLLKLQRK